MSNSPNKKRNATKKTSWRIVLASTVWYIIFALYAGIKIGSLLGAVVGVASMAFAGLIAILAIALFKPLINKLDPYNFRGEFPLFVRSFLRRKPQIRQWLVLWILGPLMTILWLDLPISSFTIGEVPTFTWVKFLVTMFFLFGMFYLISTMLPDKSGRVIPFDEVKVLLEVAKLPDTRNHFEKALKFFDEQPEADVTNCIKEAVCALEACVESLTDKPASKRFSKVIKQLEGKEPGKIPPAISRGIKSLHGYRGDAKAVSHAALQGSNVSEQEAELVLNLVASYIIYFHDLYSKDSEL